MDRSEALALLLALLMLCITAGEWGLERSRGGGDMVKTRSSAFSYVSIPQGPPKYGCKFRWRPPTPSPSLSAVDSWDLVLFPS